MYRNGRALANDLEMVIYSISENCYQIFVPYYWTSDYGISTAIRSRVFYHYKGLGIYEWSGSEMVPYSEED